MRFLRNPIVTGALVVIAVVVVYLQIAPHARFSSLTAGTPAPPALPAPAPTSSAVAPAAATPATPAAPALQPEAEIRPKVALDREFVELHFDGWVNWPQRDPFLVITPDPPEPKNKDIDADSPVASWKLKGIYAQTASKPIALINHGVYHEGDEIQQGYRIIKIEGDEVWFQGPRRKERLGMDRRMPPHP